MNIDFMSEKYITILWKEILLYNAIFWAFVPKCSKYIDSILEMSQMFFEQNAILPSKSIDYDVLTYSHN